jgi:hypothetical protein
MMSVKRNLTKLSVLAAMAAFAVAFGAKADIAFCTAHVRF